MRTLVECFLSAVSIENSLVDLQYIKLRIAYDTTVLFVTIQNIPNK